MNHKTTGMLLLLVSMFGFATMAFLIKYSGELPTIQKTLFRNLVATVISLALVLKHRLPLLGHRSSRRLLVIRSSFGTLSMVMYFYTINTIVLSDADIISKLCPFFMMIFSFLFLGEKLRPYQLLMILCAFVGVLFVVKPVLDFAVVYPYIIGVVSAVLAAAAYTCVRALSSREHYLTVVFFFSAFATLVISPFAVLYYVRMSWTQLLILILAGIFASLGQFCLTLAYKYAEAREISIFMYSSVIFSTFWSVLAFGVLPDKWSVLGYCIIFAASLFIYLQNKRVT